MNKYNLNLPDAEAVSRAFLFHFHFKCANSKTVAHSMYLPGKLTGIVMDRYSSPRSFESQNPFTHLKYWGDKMFLLIWVESITKSHCKLKLKMFLSNYYFKTPIINALYMNTNNYISQWKKLYLLIYLQISSMPGLIEDSSYLLLYSIW